MVPPRRYPAWFSNSTYNELSRTVCIGPFHDHLAGKQKVQTNISKKYGDIIECMDFENNDSTFIGYLRFHENCSTLSEQTINGFDFAYKLSSGENGDPKDSEWSVLPAVINSFLWIGEIPRRKDGGEDIVKEALTLVGPAPEEITVASDGLPKSRRRKSWGLARYASDRQAAEVLVASRKRLVTPTELPWPLAVRAFAPGEDSSPQFILSLATQRTSGSGGVGAADMRLCPPHFVASNTLEWELCHAWRRLNIVHRSQRESLRGMQWVERHRLMARARPASERDRWECGAAAGPEGPAVRRELFVGGIRAGCTEDELRNWMQGRYGPVDDVLLLSQPVGTGTHEGLVLLRGWVRMASYDGARRAVEDGARTLESPMGSLTLRYYFEFPILWVGELTRHLTNQSLKEAFDQFGVVRQATVAAHAVPAGALPGGSVGHSYGAVEFAKHSAASELLAVMDGDMLVLPGASRPVRAEAYAPRRSKRWARGTPAVAAEAAGRPRRVLPGDPDWPACLDARDMQERHFAEWLALKGLQAQGRRALEGQQRDRLLAENRKLEGLKKRMREAEAVAAAATATAAAAAVAAAAAGAASAAAPAPLATRHPGAAVGPAAAPLALAVPLAAPALVDPPPPPKKRFGEFRPAPAPASSEGGAAAGAAAGGRAEGGGAEEEWRESTFDLELSVTAGQADHLRKHHSIRLLNADARQKFVFRAALRGPERGGMEWARWRGVLTARGLLPCSLAQQASRGAGAVEWQLGPSSDAGGGGAAAAAATAQRLGKFLAEYQLAAVLDDSPQGRLYLLPPAKDGESFPAAIVPHGPPPTPR